MTIQHLYPTTRPSLDLNFARTKRLDPRVTFTRGSTATYVGSDGLIKTAASNEARFDHDPATGESLGLLIEHARTNYQKFSNTFNSAGLPAGDLRWQDFVEISLQNNLYPDPFGTSTATRIIPTTNSSLHYIGRYQTYSTGVYAHSLFLKPAGYSRLQILGNTDTFTVNLSGSGSFVNTNSTTYATKIQPLANGWYRLEWLWNNTGGGGANTAQPRITILDNSGNSTFAGDGVSGIDLFGYQQEVGSFSTSYIPTTSATVTRSSDVADMTGTNFSSWYNQSEGTTFVHLKNIKAQDYTLAPFIAYDGNNSLWDNNQEYGLRYNDSGTTLQAVVQDSSAGTISLNKGGDVRAETKAVIALNSTQFALTRDGLSVSTNTTSGPMSNITRLALSLNSGPRQSTHFTRLTYYPTRLTDAQLQALTL